MMLINNDCLTGYPLEPRYVVPFRGAAIYEYFHRAVGNVKISYEAFDLIQNDNFQERRNVIAGLCRNRKENDIPPFELLMKHCSMPLPELEKEVDQIIPKNFQEKAMHLLKHMELKGGREYHKFSFNPKDDYPLTFGDKDEFTRVLEFLIDQRFIKGQRTSTKDNIFFQNLTLTKEGMAWLQEEKEQVNITIKSDLKPRLVKLVVDNNWDALFLELEQILTESGQREGLILVNLTRARYNDLIDNKRSGLISDKDSAVELQQLRKSILEIIQ